MNNNNQSLSEKSRRIDLDFIKAFAIFLVLWGHAIQYWHGSGYEFNRDPIYKFIYGFHMPLFAAVSGYLFWGTIQRYSAGDILVRKFNKLIIPCLFLAILLPSGENILMSVLSRSPLGFEHLLEQIFKSVIGNFWFYKAIFISSLVCLVISKFPSANNSLFFISVMFAAFIPEVYPFDSIAYVYPFFVIGLFFRKNKLDIKTGKAVICIALAAYVGLLLFQIKFYKFIDNAVQNILMIHMLKYWYRIILGIAGCTAVISFFKSITIRVKMEENHLKPLIYISKNTGDIYIVSTLIFVVSSAFINTLGFGTGNSGRYWLFLDLLLILVSILLLILCLCIIKLVHKYPHLQRWILGM